MEKKLVNSVLKIEGMTCSSCEMRIENKLKKMEGVEEAKVLYTSSKLYITYDSNKIQLDSVIRTVEELDYKVISEPDGNEISPQKEMDDSEYKLNINQVLGIGIIILAGYLIIKNTVGFNFIPQVNNNMGYGILFVVGLLTSIHCIAMCGGINLSQCVAYKCKEEDETGFSKIKPSLLYNGGRVLSYTIIGGIVGAMGALVSFSGTAKGIVAIVAGIFMVIMGVNMLNIFPWLRKLNPRMPRIIANKINADKGKYGPFIVGLLNGLMPCGPLQAMQIYALGTGSFLAGAASMFFFSMGTVPLMFGFGAVSSILSRKFNHKMMKVSAILVIVLGIMMTGRGFNLSGINISFANSGKANIAKVEEGVQKVSSEVKSGSYEPIVVQKGIPVIWTIKVDEGELNGCNNPVTIPKYNIVKTLMPGDNVIEFTPEESGNITFTCWMGMINGNIKVVDNIEDANIDVVDNIGNANIDEQQQGIENIVPAKGCGCCR